MLNVGSIVLGQETVSRLGIFHLQARTHEKLLSATQFCSCGPVGSEILLAGRIQTDLRKDRIRNISFQIHHGYVQFFLKDEILIIRRLHHTSSNKLEGFADSFYVQSFIIMYSQENFLDNVLGSNPVLE